MAKVKVRRTHREELPGLALLRDAVAADTPGFPEQRSVLDIDMEIDPDLTHLQKHDPDGFLTAIERDETLGFAAAHVRSRQCMLSELWVLPQHRGKGAGEALLARALAYGDRSGAREYLALAPVAHDVQSLLLRHDLKPLTPVYSFRVPAECAARLASSLARLQAGKNVTGDLLKLKGQADLNRIDRLTRNITREVDHAYWLKVRHFRAAFVRQGARIGAYAYGGAEQIGPVAGSTQEAALSAIGWALQVALDAAGPGPLELRVPARFTPAIEALQEGGARLQATFLLYGRGITQAFDRCTLGPPGLP